MSRSKIKYYLDSKEGKLPNLKKKIKKFLHV